MQCGVADVGCEVRCRMWDVDDASVEYGMSGMGYECECVYGECAECCGVGFEIM